MTSAIVFVLSRHMEDDAYKCLDYCTARGYAIAGIVRDDWDAALGAIRAGLATIVVVADTAHLDETCTPRMEVVANMPTADGPSGQRTQMLRRNAGG